MNISSRAIRLSLSFRGETNRIRAKSPALVGPRTGDNVLTRDWPFRMLNHPARLGVSATADPADSALELFLWHLAHLNLPTAAHEDPSFDRALQ
jgi:hypothetical protein